MSPEADAETAMAGIWLPCFYARRATGGRLPRLAGDLQPSRHRCVETVRARRKPCIIRSRAGP